MKRAAIIIVSVFAFALLLSACNKEACPAYSQQDNDGIENVG